MTSTKDDKSIPWHEYNVHTTNNNTNNHQEEEEEPISLFTSNIPNYSNVTYKEFITLRVEEDYDKSTGVLIWNGSEVLLEYLWNYNDPNSNYDPNNNNSNHLIKNKRVLELGAGVGLCGVACATEKLGAAEVMVTDGDCAVLENLRYNVELNSKSGGAGVISSKCRVQCRQLIWGKEYAERLEQERKEEREEEWRDCDGDGGDMDDCKFDVIMAADCIYIAQNVRPMLETVSYLLSDKPGSKFLFVNTCASTCSKEDIFRIAEDEFGLCHSMGDEVYHDEELKYRVDDTVHVLYKSRKEEEGI